MFPGRWIRNWHHDIICDKLQKIESGEISRLIVTMPPRHSKTEICSKAFPAWAIGRNPDRQIIVSTYAASLAENISRSVQTTIRSSDYQRIFPDISISIKHSSLTAWSVNDSAKDTLIAVGVGGPITGKGGDIVIIDDPIKNRKEADSELIRNNTWEWYRSTLRTRLNPGASIIVIMTRWHEDDLVGRLAELQENDTEADKWEILNLPAIAESDTVYRKKGEALFTQRYPIKALAGIKASIGTREFDTLYQCRPSAPEGARFKRAWFKIASTYDTDSAKVRYWDWAVTPEDGDYTVGTMVARDHEGKYKISDVIRDRLGWTDTQRVIYQTAKIDGKDVFIGIEEVAKDAAFLKELKTKLLNAGYKVITMRNREKKETRAYLWEPLAELGAISLVRGEWNQAWLAEICSFPLAAHDDQVDSMSGAMEMLRVIRKDGGQYIIDRNTKKIDAHRVEREDESITTDPREILEIL